KFLQTGENLSEPETYRNVVPRSTGKNKVFILFCFPVAPRLSGRQCGGYTYSRLSCQKKFKLSLIAFKTALFLTSLAAARRFSASLFPPDVRRLAPVSRPVWRRQICLAAQFRDYTCYCPLSQPC